MQTSEFYGAGSRLLQDRFDSRRIADRLEQVIVASKISAAHRELIETAPMFFLATADAQGRPDVSYKGGLPGFVRVTGPAELAFPDYNGNGMFKSLGAIIENPSVALLFIRWSDKPKRLRILGRASISEKETAITEFQGAQQLVRVKIERIFDNCPRYVHTMRLENYSPYGPASGHTPPVPEWKRDPLFCDALPKDELQLLNENE
jgi:uncharacterized protein